MYFYPFSIQFVVDSNKNKKGGQTETHKEFYWMLVWSRLTDTLYINILNIL